MKFREYITESKEINFEVKSDKEVDDILMELSYEDDLGKDDYENGTISGSKGDVYGVYSGTKKGQNAIRKVCKELKIKFKEN